MNILLQGRKSFHADPGGDAIQTSAYREYLEKAGVRVNLSLESEPDLNGVDIVHCFNLQVVDQTFRQIRHAKSQGKKVVFSPIYWNMEEYQRFRIDNAKRLGSHRLKEAAKKHWNAQYDCFRNIRKSGDYRQIGVLAQMILKGKRSLQKRCLEMSDLILVSAPSEKEILVKDFHLQGRADKVRILPNGVDHRFDRSDPESFVRQYGVSGFLLCVARMEPHKNQITVLQAVRKLPYTLVLIGSQRDPRYLALCKREAGPNTLFLDYMPHELLGSAYAAAQAHILASWFDIPGLVSLEAGLAGCNVISTNRGSAADYLGAEAWYVDPNDPGSIQRAVSAAMETPKKGELRHRLAEQYSWEKIAGQLQNYYQEVLEPVLSPG